MKIKEIRIRSREESDKELRKMAKTLDDGKAPSKPLTGEFFESLEAVRSVLTERRLELWRVIRDRKPLSISDLAEMLQRSFRSVHRDVVLLNRCGLIKLKKNKGMRGDRQTPVTVADKIILPVA